MLCIAYMLPSSHRIIDTASGARPFAAWLSGLAVAMLTLGTYGALQPLLPPSPEVFATTDDSLEALDFQPPAEATAEPQADEPQEQTPEPEVDVEIPPLPEITPPLAPPEVAELVPMDTPPPPPAPKQKPPERKREVEPKPKPQPRRPASSGGASTKAGTSGVPTLFNGSGGGRFPEPSYPAAARASRIQGSVRLVVTVEESGLPSSVDVQSSSGSTILDNAASDHIRRRWRWPAGPVRRYIVPVRFQLR